MKRKILLLKDIMYFPLRFLQRQNFSCTMSPSILILMHYHDTSRDLLIRSFMFLFLTAAKFVQSHLLETTKL